MTTPSTKIAESMPRCPKCNAREGVHLSLRGENGKYHCRPCHLYFHLSKDAIVESMLDAMAGNEGELPVPNLDDWTLRALNAYRHLRRATCALYGEDGLDELWTDIHSLTERLEKICANRGIDIQELWRATP